jgi:hypothetical protein
MIDQPHFESYSIPARICLAVATCGSGLLLAMVSSYFMP